MASDAPSLRRHLEGRLGRWPALEAVLEALTVVDVAPPSLDAVGRWAVTELAAEGLRLPWGESEASTWLRRRDPSIGPGEALPSRVAETLSARDRLIVQLAEEAAGATRRGDDDLWTVVDRLVDACGADAATASLVSLVALLHGTSPCARGVAVLSTQQTVGMLQAAHGSIRWSIDGWIESLPDEARTRACLAMAEALARRRPSVPSYAFRDPRDVRFALGIDACPRCERAFAEAFQVGVTFETWACTGCGCAGDAADLVAWARFQQPLIELDEARRGAVAAWFEEEGQAVAWDVAIRHPHLVRFPAVAARGAWRCRRARVPLEAANILAMAITGHPAHACSMAAVTTFPSPAPPFVPDTGHLLYDRQAIDRHNAIADWLNEHRVLPHPAFVLSPVEHAFSERWERLHPRTVARRTTPAPSLSDLADIEAMWAAREREPNDR